MQQKYFKYVLLAIVVAFIIPQITLAAWYNPLSWNWNVFDWFSKPQITAVSHANLTLSDINNATYTVNGIQAQFSGGKFHPERDSSSSVDQGLNAVISSYALGDINGDGNGDAVVVIEYGMGNSTIRTDALEIVLNVNGKPQTTNVTIPSHSGENLAVGFSVNSIDASGVIKMTLDVLPPDGDYNNLLETTREYNYQSGVLVETQASLNTGVSSTSWKTYDDAQYGFSFEYPAAYGISNTLQPSSYFALDVSQLASAYSLQNDYINSAIFQVLAGNSSNDISNCLKEPNQVEGGVNITKQKLINGNVFYVVAEKVGDDAMGGGRGLVSYYQILHNNYCYIIESTIYYHQVGWPDNTATPEQAQLQNNAVASNSAILDQIFSTFKFTN